MQRLRTFLTKQRGAMFGMDARVALAIFGTLALIGGYTMIGRIDTARTGKFIKELSTISEGLAALQTDTGRMPSLDWTSPTDIFEVVCQDPGIAKWNGPYVSDCDSSENLGDRIIPPGGGAWSSAALQNDRTTACAYGENCYVWLSVNNFPEDTFITINDVIDENGGTDAETTPASEGRVRFTGAGTGTLHFRAFGWDTLRGRTVK